MIRPGTAGTAGTIASGTAGSLTLVQHNWGFWQCLFWKRPICSLQKEPLPLKCDLK